MAGGDPSIATYLAITFLAARTLYPLAYLSGIGWLRTIVFSVGMAATSALFLLPYYSYCRTTPTAVLRLTASR